MLFTHVSNFVHKSPKMTKLFRRFREEIAHVWVKIVVVFGQSIFITSLTYQLSSLVLEIFFEWVVILKFLILFCVWSIYVFSAPFFKKVCLKSKLRLSKFLSFSRCLMFEKFCVLLFLHKWVRNNPYNVYIFWKGGSRAFQNRFDHVHTAFLEHCTIPRVVRGI